MGIAAAFIATTSQSWRREIRHAPWCGRWCRDTNAALGEHRSDPITAQTTVGGACVVGTRIARLDGRQYLDLRLTIPLSGGGDEQRAAIAERAMRAITKALLRALAPRPATTQRHR